MDIYMPMSTNLRHNKVTRKLGSRLVEWEEKNKGLVLQEECSLVHWGGEKRPCELKLIDLSEIKDIDYFMSDTIEDLEKVQPDLAFFNKNKYVTNKRETKVAGCPDLIVEVWSDGNTQSHRDYKKYLYSTSSITEHWYIEQDANKVECYIGKEQLPDQYLTNILKTQNGIEFDLRYLAV